MSNFALPHLKRIHADMDYNSIMRWALIGFIFSPFLELLGHWYLAALRRKNLLPDVSVQELLRHHKWSVFFAAVWVALCRLILVLSMLAAASAFFIMR